ncbi:MAG: fumarylacetoacetate hydrolase family protein [Actinomycetota bacterium]
MAVNAIRYERDGEVRWGVVSDDGVRPVVGSYDSTRAFVLEAAATVRAGEHPLDDPVPLDEVTVLSPVTADQQFLCQAVNYRSHMEESGLSPEASPFNVFFRKASSCLSPPHGDIVSPAHVELLDHEVEIGLVLARDVDGPVTVADDELASHVAALVAVNDVSARDVQLGDTQFYRAKSYRTFGPTGPHLALVDRHDLDRFAELRLRLWVDGVTRQDALAADMVHRPAATLTELSSVQDWRAGDLLATGTPGGCALRAPAAPLRMLAQAVSPRRRHALVQRSAARNPRRLRPGDRVELHIGTEDGAIDLGRQETAVVAG